MIHYRGLKSCNSFSHYWFPTLHLNFKIQMQQRNFCLNLNLRHQLLSSGSNSLEVGSADWCVMMLFKLWWERCSGRKRFGLRIHFEVKKIKEYSAVSFALLCHTKSRVQNLCTTVMILKSVLPHFITFNQVSHFEKFGKVNWQKHHQWQGIEHHVKTLVFQLQFF